MPRLLAVLFAQRGATAWTQTQDPLHAMEVINPHEAIFLHFVMSCLNLIVFHAGYQSNDGWTNCTACPSAYACPSQSDPGQNTPCAEGSYSEEGQATCTLCPAGKRCPYTEWVLFGILLETVDSSPTSMLSVFQWNWTVPLEHTRLEGTRLVLCALLVQSAPRRMEVGTKIANLDSTLWLVSINLPCN